jgi:molybdopterin molybdotransferase
MRQPPPSEPMLTIEEAVALVQEHAQPLAPCDRSLIDGLGSVLAEDVAADTDEPPFDKALVDGYAVRAADLVEAVGRLRVGETILAGQTPTRSLGPREAAAIMTGAPLPPGADAVLMHERTRALGGEILTDEIDVPAGRNRLLRGQVYRAGDVVLRKGSRLSPASLGLLASVGRPRVMVIPRPTLAIVPTGDELVPPEQTPGPGQIRNSNAVMLQALAVSRGVTAHILPIAPDESSELKRILKEGLGSDVLVITGGVSAGQRDLVPAALAELGVTRIFHKIRLKPGKPLWFGTVPRQSDRAGTLVFGLPGNPVSGLVGFLLFVGPALHHVAGRSESLPEPIEARLGGTFTHRGDRPTYHPARWLERPGDRWTGVVEPLPWAGSADLLAVAKADGFAVFPAGDRSFQPGEIVRFVSLD